MKNYVLNKEDKEKFILNFGYINNGTQIKINYADGTSNIVNYDQNTVDNLLSKMIYQVKIIGPEFIKRQNINFVLNIICYILCAIITINSLNIGLLLKVLFGILGTCGITLYNMRIVNLIKDAKKNILFADNEIELNNRIVNNANRFYEENNNSKVFTNNYEYVKPQYSYEYNGGYVPGFNEEEYSRLVNGIDINNMDFFGYDGINESVTNIKREKSIGIKAVDNNKGRILIRK